MRFDRDANDGVVSAVDHVRGSNPPGNHHLVRPFSGYGALDPAPRHQSAVVDNMMYYQGLVKPQPTSSGSKRTVIPNLVGQAPPPPSPGGRSFAAALRNLAKQAGPSSSNSTNDKEGIESHDRHHQESSLNGRMSLPSCNKLQLENESKPMLNAEHRSGFQPYKPDDQRTLVPTTVSAPSPHFNPVTYPPFHPASLYSPHFQQAYSRLEEQIYLERCGVPLFPPPPYPHGSPHPSAIYGLHHLQSPLVMPPNIVDRMKMEEDRLQRDRDMQERERRDKAKQQQKVKNVQTSAADLSARKASLKSTAHHVTKPQFGCPSGDIKLPNS